MEEGLFNGLIFNLNIDKHVYLLFYQDKIMQPFTKSNSILKSKNKKRP